MCSINAESPLNDVRQRGHRLLTCVVFVDNSVEGVVDEGLFAQIEMSIN